MVAFNIETAFFEVAEGAPERRFNAPLTALTRETSSGKSTLLEAIWWTLGVDHTKLMRAAAACARIGFTARIGPPQWRITRSTTNPQDDVAFTNITTGVEEQHPVKGGESRRAAADAFQDLLGIPRLGTGRTRVTLDLLQPWIYARQDSLPTQYLGGQGKEQRVCVGRVLLGADHKTVDALRQDSADKTKKWRSAKNRVKRILRDREEHELPSVENLQRRAAQWTAQHQEGSAQARHAGADLSRLQRELAALEQKASAAEEARRTARTAADDRERTARLLEAAAAEARGRLAGLREAATDPSLCPQCVRPLDLAGLSQDDCPVCRRIDPEPQQRAQQFQQRMTQAQQGAERAREAARRAAQAAEDARGRAGDADRAHTEAWASARGFAQDVIAPQQQIVVEAEASVREVAARLEHNTEHLRELAELTGLREQLPQLQEPKEAAEAAYTAARNDTDLMVKQGTDRWSDHLLRRMRACDPEITTASVSPEDFSVTINGGAFDSTVVTGHGRTRINVSTLLALRDAAREVPAMPVPQFLMLDSPFTGLGNSPKDQRTGAALLDGLTELATSQHPSGAGGQVIIACTELHGSPKAAVREIRTSLADGAIPGLPPRDSDTP
ncbi:ATP-binding protein [Streptomyces sp. NPDC005803]|uniref:ATP-binding protein n=1 Tax=Streptomyces sp. NPDC005803 TaxID=3154297 RepID=UPI0033E67A26